MTTADASSFKRLPNSWRASAVTWFPFLAAAREAPGRDVARDLAGFLLARAQSIRAAGVEELWMAVSTRDAAWEGVPARLRDMIFAIGEQLLEPAEWEPRADWPGGRLEWFEVCRLTIREI